MLDPYEASLFASIVVVIHSLLTQLYQEAQPNPYTASGWFQQQIREPQIAALGMRAAALTSVPPQRAAARLAWALATVRTIADPDALSCAGDGGKSSSDTTEGGSAERDGARLQSASRPAPRWSHWDASGASITASLAAARGADRSGRGGGGDGNGAAAASSSDEAAQAGHGVDRAAGIEVAALELALVVLSNALVATRKRGALALRAVHRRSRRGRRALVRQAQAIRKGRRTKRAKAATQSQASACPCAFTKPLDDVWATIAEGKGGEVEVAALRLALRNWHADSHGSALWGAGCGRRLRGRASHAPTRRRARGARAPPRRALVQRGAGLQSLHCDGGGDRGQRPRVACSRGADSSSRRQQYTAAEFRQMLRDAEVSEVSDAVARVLCEAGGTPGASAATVRTCGAALGRALLLRERCLCCRV